MEKELIKRALLGDKQAQKECTEKGIVLPCPFCGSIMEFQVQDGELGKPEIIVSHPNNECLLSKLDVTYDNKDGLKKWNTRAPAIYFCEHCPYWKTPYCYCSDKNIIPSPFDFCSFGQPVRLAEPYKPNTLNKQE